MTILEDSVNELVSQTTQLLNTVNVSKQTLDNAKNAAELAAIASESSKTQSVVAKDLSQTYRNESETFKQQAEDARDDAVAVVYEGEASLDPGPGKIPVAGAGGNINRAWLADLEFLDGSNAAALHRSPNAITALFVYDTSKDSDGGAWTQKCQGTSWYNESINGRWLGAHASEAAARAVSGATTGDYFQLSTNGRFYSLGAGSGTTETFRGNKRDFPRLCAIVAESASVTIYDLTEPGNPMWMRFTALSTSDWWGTSNAITNLAIVNAQMAVSSANGGARFVDFSKDRTRVATIADGGQPLRGLSDRNQPIIWTGSGRPLIASAAVNAVAMTVLPDAPVDPVSGLKVPTIAVATNGGVSLLKHNGTVVNGISTAAFDHVTLTPQLLSAGLASQYFWYYANNPGALGASFAFLSRDPTQSPDFNAGNTNGLLAHNRSEIVRRSATAATVQKLRNWESDPAKSLAVTISNLFNTGHQPGDIRRTFLSSKEAGSVATGPELVTNGTFDTDLTGWNIGAGSPTVVGGVMQANTTSSSWIIDQTIDVVAGRAYALTVTAVSSITACYGYNSAILGVNPAFLLLGNGTPRTAFFVATGSKFRIGIYSTVVTPGIHTVDNISVKEVVADRSYKNSGASIAGTLTASPVNTNAELVAYSGFSAANYLREPYSADLDFGTGEWGLSSWTNIPATLPQESFPDAGVELLTPASGPYEEVPSWVTAVGSTSSISGGGAVRVSVNVTAVSGRLEIQISGVVVGKCYRLAVALDSNFGAMPGSWVGTSQINFTALPPGPSNFNATLRATSTTITMRFYPRTAVATGQTAGDYVEFSSFSVRETKPVIIADRAYSSGASLQIGVNALSNLTATAFDGTTTRTVTTAAAYNSATWIKPEAVYTTDGTLAIRVNGVEVAATRGNPLLTLNNSDAVLTIGNSYSLDAPFPGSLALLKLSATVPTPEQSIWMYEQEKQLFREGAKCCLPDGGALVDLAYDEATDKWIAASAANISEWTGLVRTNVIASPAGSYSKLSAGGGVTLQGRTTTSPGVDVTIPAQGLREELVNRAEAAARLNANAATFDYVGGFTANTTNGSTAIASVAGLSYPTNIKGAKVTGSGIPADTVVSDVSGTTIYLSKATTATATGVQIAFTDFALPVGYEARTISVAGALKQEGSTKDYTKLFDGFKETVRFGVAPAYDAWVQITATRS